MFDDNDIFYTPEEEVILKELRKKCEEEKWTCVKFCEEYDKIFPDRKEKPEPRPKSQPKKFFLLDLEDAQKLNIKCQEENWSKEKLCQEYRTAFPQKEDFTDSEILEAIKQNAEYIEHSSSFEKSYLDDHYYESHFYWNKYNRQPQYSCFYWNDNDIETYVDFSKIKSAKFDSKKECFVFETEDSHIKFFTKNRDQFKFYFQRIYLRILSLCTHFEVYFSSDAF